MICSMTLPSKLCAALHSQNYCWFNVLLQAMQKFELVSLGGNSFYQESTVTMVQVPEGKAVSTQGQHYIQ